MRQGLVLVGVGLWLLLVAWVGGRSDRRRAFAGDTTIPRVARALGQPDDFGRWQCDGARTLHALRLGAWALVATGAVVMLLVLLL